MTRNFLTVNCPKVWPCFVLTAFIKTMTRLTFRKNFFAFAGVSFCKQGREVRSFFGNLNRTSLWHFDNVTRSMRLAMPAMAIIVDVIDCFCCPIAEQEQQKGAAKAAQYFSEGHCVEHVAFRFGCRLPPSIRFHAPCSRCKRRDQSPLLAQLPGTAKMLKRIAFQGDLGAYSHQACVDARPDYTPIPCATFEDVIETVRRGDAELALLPVENTTYGRVADMHRLLPESGLHIHDEAFVRVHISLMAMPGLTLDDIDTVRAHLVLLPQCREFLSRHNIRGEAAADSAGAAADIAAQKNMSVGALASDLAAEIHGLNILARHIEDHDHNTTRFLLMGREPNYTRRGDHGMITSFVFRVRNIPAALYKAMGGFATNGVNMTKLESYMVGGAFTATQFYADIEGHPDDRNVQLAMEELDYFTSNITVLGTYPADPNRK